MGILNSLINIGRQQRDAVAASLEDPARDGKYNIEDAKREIDSLTTQIVRLTTANNINIRNQQEATDKATSRQKAAEAAVAAGKTDDARQLLTQKKNFADTAASLQSEIDANAKTIASLRKQRDDDQAQVAKAESSLARISAQQTGNALRQSVAQQTATYGGGNSAVSRLAKLNEAAQESDAKTAAWETEASLKEQSTGDDLVAKYAPADTSVDDELNKLIAARGQPAAAPTAPTTPAPVAA